jgi:hypothetical protein
MWQYLEKCERHRKPSNQFRLGPIEEIDDHTVLAPLLRYRGAWRRSVEEKNEEPSPAEERVLDYLLEKRLAAFGRIKADLAVVLDEDMLKSTLAQLIDDCWIEIVR